MSDPFNNFGVFFINLYHVGILFAITYYPVKLFCEYMFGKFIIIDVILFIMYFIGIVFTSNTIFIYLLFLILYLIMYVFYLIIIYIIPETGFLTLFIPIRELLLKIPPLPILIDKGVFKTFDNFFSFIGGSINYKKFFNNYAQFAKNNIIEYIRLFNPDIDSIIEELQNKNKNDNDNDNDIGDVSICVNSQAPLTTPNMNFVDLFMNEIKNAKNNVKCNLNSIKAYIKTSADEASMETKDAIKNT